MSATGVNRNRANPYTALAIADDHLKDQEHFAMEAAQWLAGALDGMGQRTEAHRLRARVIATIMPAPEWADTSFTAIFDHSAAALRRDGLPDSASAVEIRKRDFVGRVVRSRP